MRIYTRTGDSGLTALPGGERVRKDDARVVACGELDELNALLGLAAALCSDGRLREILHHLQGQLLVLGAGIASLGARQGPSVVLASDDVAHLEATIDALSTNLPSLHNFVLPGGSPCGAVLHVARAVCRRVERSLLSLSTHYELPALWLPFLNRLSDLLFVMARTANAIAGVGDNVWTSGSVAKGNG